jgi:hypothetical protein
MRPKVGVPGFERARVSPLSSPTRRQRSSPSLVPRYVENYHSNGIDHLEVSPDGTWVAFNVGHFVDLDYGSIRNLYLVPTNGSLAPRIVSTAVPNPYASNARFTTDSTRVVFTSFNNYYSSQHLFSATMTGPPTPLDDPGSHVPTWSLDASGSTVYFGQEGLGVYRVPVDGSVSPTLLSPIAATEKVANLELSADGNWVAFAALEDGLSGISELLSVPSAGGPTTSLAPSTARLGLEHIDPGSNIVVFHQTVYSQTAPPRTELQSVPIDGSRLPRRVNDHLPPGGTVQVGGTVQANPSFAPGLALYIASQASSGAFELFKAPLEWSGNVRVGP